MTKLVDNLLNQTEALTYDELISYLAQFDVSAVIAAVSYFSRVTPTQARVYVAQAYLDHDIEHISRIGDMMSKGRFLLTTSGFMKNNPELYEVSAYLYKTEDGAEALEPLEPLEGSIFPEELSTEGEAQEDNVISIDSAKE